jgi:phage major head subunit gpT-like protein
MALVGTGSLAKALWPGVKAWVGADYKEVEHQFKEIFPMIRSEKNYEQDVTLGPTGLLQVKPEGQNIAYDSFIQGFVKNYTHIVYASGFIITREAIDDNMYMELAEKRSRMLGRSAKETKEITAANILNRAFNSTYTGADGLELCSTAHLFEKGGTYKNELTTAADLSEASLEQACIDIMDFRDGANKRIAASPRKLIVPTALAFEAERILKSTLQNDSANNAINALKSKGILPEGYAVNRYLTDADAFFLLTDCPDGLKHYQRRDLEVSDDTDFDSENMKFKISERYVFGWTDPRGIFGSPGAA